MMHSTNLWPNCPTVKSFRRSVPLPALRSMPPSPRLPPTLLLPPPPPPPPPLPPKNPWTKAASKAAWMATRLDRWNLIFALETWILFWNVERIYYENYFRQSLLSVCANNICSIYLVSFNQCFLFEGKILAKGDSWHWHFIHLCHSRTQVGHRNC